MKGEEKKPRARWAARFLFAALLFAFQAHAVPELDQPAPPLKGVLLSGEPFDVAQMRGKVVLLNFYSSYCKYCAYEIGNLETIYERYRAEGLEVIELAVDDVGDRERVRHILTNYGLPGAMVQELSESGFERRYPTPTTFLIDRAGVLRHKHWGAKTAPYFREILLPLLQEKKEGPPAAARQAQ